MAHERKVFAGDEQQKHSKKRYQINTAFYILNGINNASPLPPLQRRGGRSESISDPIPSPNFLLIPFSFGEGARRAAEAERRVRVRQKMRYFISFAVYFFLSLTLLPTLIIAQNEVLSPLQINPVVADKWKEISQSNFKMLASSSDTLSLPFLDDFSKESVYPDTALWIDRAAFINHNYPKAPVTIGVATLEGLDSTGYPYNFGAIVNSTGIADHLTSKPINLGSPLTTADSIYLSFFYQPEGNGDYPQAQDSLILEFRSPAKDWTKVWYKNGYNPADNDSSFHLVMIPLTDTAYLKNGFQFRFKNYTTLSGNNDHWHIDYVYLNKLRNRNDTVFDDISFVYDPPSLLKNYREIPWNHYTSSDMANAITMFMRNNDDVLKNTTYKYLIKDPSGTILDTYSGGSMNVDPYFSNGYNNYAPHANPVVNYAFPALTDSTVFEIEHILNATPDFNRWNDTSRFFQNFYNYYAYDDGTAEAVYGINKSKGKVAYKFTINTTDTLRAVQIYFNPVVTNASVYSFRIAVWNDNGGNPGQLIYQDSVVYPKYEKNTYNKFITYMITNPALLINSGTFYIGWIQETNNFLNVGFDKNTNSQNKIFFNLSQTWETTNFKGSLMIRPVFGEAFTLSGVDAPLALNKNGFEIYPNPAQDKVYIMPLSGKEQNALQLSIFDIYGKLVFTDKNFNGRTLDVSSFSGGMYFVRIKDDKNNVFIKKLMIKK